MSTRKYFLEDVLGLLSQTYSFNQIVLVDDDSHTLSADESKYTPYSQVDNDPEIRDLKGIILHQIEDVSQTIRDLREAISVTALTHEVPYKKNKLFFEGIEYILETTKDVVNPYKPVNYVRLYIEQPY